MDFRSKSAKTKGGPRRTVTGSAIAETAAALPLLVVAATILGFILFDILAVGIYKLKLAAVTSQLAQIAAQEFSYKVSSVDMSARANILLRTVGMPACTSCLAERIDFEDTPAVRVRIKVEGLPVIPVEQIASSEAGLSDSAIAFISFSRGLIGSSNASEK